MKNPIGLGKNRKGLNYFECCKFHFWQDRRKYHVFSRYRECKGIVQLIPKLIGHFMSDIIEANSKVIVIVIFPLQFNPSGIFFNHLVSYISNNPDSVLKKIQI